MLGLAKSNIFGQLFQLIAFKVGHAQCQRISEENETQQSPHQEEVLFQVSYKQEAQRKGYMT